jgi:hypothetical protein
MLEKLKENIQKRTERNAIKSTLTWHKTKKRNGKVIKDEEITETVYLKRSRIPLVGDWGRIHPIVVENSFGELKWKVSNFIFGGRRNFIKLIIVLAIVALVFLGFKEIFTQYDSLRSVCEPMLNIGF